jgi:hypothetical protein
MYKSFLRLLAFASFVAWCVSVRRAHHYETQPEPYDFDDDDEYHTEGFDARKAQ